MAETKTFSLEELQKHTSERDCWLAIHGKVYNVTEFLDEHPGESWACTKLIGCAPPRLGARSPSPPSLCTHQAAMTSWWRPQVRIVAAQQNVIGATAPAACRPQLGPRGPVHARISLGPPPFPFPTGKDATEDYEEIGHSSTATEMLDKYLVGKFAVRWGR